MRRSVAATGVLLGMMTAEPVRAQVPAGPTLLHLEATGTVQVAPDLLVAQLVAEVRSADPAAAQRQVNRSVTGATAQAGTVGGLTWRLQDYAVEHDEAPPRQWSARQTLVLQDREAAPLLDLAGRLQSAGLTLADLSWTLSPAARQAAMGHATEVALKALQADAAAAAAALGLRVGRIRDVTLLDSDGVRPMMRVMARMSAPEDTRDAQDVSRRASAEIELHP